MFGVDFAIVLSDNQCMAFEDLSKSIPQLKTTKVTLTLSVSLVLQ